MLQALGDQIIFVTRPDKKKILFYNDKHCQFAVDEGMNCCCLDTNLYKLIQVFFSHVVADAKYRYPNWRLALKNMQ